MIGQVNPAACAMLGHPPGARATCGEPDLGHHGRGDAGEHFSDVWLEEVVLHQGRIGSREVVYQIRRA